MKQIHLIMPMGGGGTRFGNKGFNVPKPLINLKGKPFFYWATQSVIKFVDVKDITFVVLQEHIDKYNINSKILEYYPKANIVVIPKLLNGAVLTCLEGVKLIEDDLPILFNDCDHAFICDTFNRYCIDGEFDQLDGALLTFDSNKDCYSYVEFDENNKVIGTVEKKVVSKEAICGAYYFRNKDIFKDSVKEYLKECSYSEFFVSGVYNIMVKKGHIIKTFNADEHISFGTPNEYDEAINDNRLERLI